MSETKAALDAIVKVVHDERAAREDFEARSKSERREFEAKADSEFAKAQAVLKEMQDAAAKAARFAMASANSDAPDNEHRKAFIEWMRHPRDQRANAQLQEIQRKSVFTTGTGGSAAGGYAVPEEIDRAIVTQLTNVSPMRSLARVVTASTPDYKILVDTLGTGTSWVGEKAARSETNTPQLGEVAPTFGSLIAYPSATEESLNDMFFDVAGWLTSSVSTAFAAAEGVAFTTGDGSNKPTGVMTNTKSTSDDASLTFGQVQYVPTGAAAGFPPLAITSPVTYPGDVIINCAHKLKAGHRANARWMMNKATLAVVRKFKDVDANYLWQPGLQLGVPGTLYGYPVVENEDMADIGSNTFPIAFGDFFAAYTIVDLVGMRVTLDEVTTPGYVKWYFRKRVGGKLTNNQAIKVIKCATT
jgi:HK97 family phage major capsid protein